jgi:hypothetical protein
MPEVDFPYEGNIGEPFFNLVDGINPRFPMLISAAFIVLPELSNRNGLVWNWLHYAAVRSFR